MRAALVLVLCACGGASAEAPAAHVAVAPEAPGLGDDGSEPDWYCWGSAQGESNCERTYEECARTAETIARTFGAPVNCFDQTSAWCYAERLEDETEPERCHVSQRSCERGLAAFADESEITAPCTERR